MTSVEPVNLAGRLFEFYALLYHLFKHKVVSLGGLSFFPEHHQRDWSLVKFFPLINSTGRLRVALFEFYALAVPFI